MNASRRVVNVICMHRQSNIMTSCDDAMPAVALTNVLECSICAKFLPSVQQFRLHQFKHHGIIRPARRYIGELNDCPVCLSLRRYPTRTQAIRHLTNSPLCAGYDDFADEMSDEVINKLEVAENIKIQGLLKAVGFSCSARRSLPNVVGPLRSQFIQCFSGRAKGEPPES